MSEVRKGARDSKDSAPPVALVKAYTLVSDPHSLEQGDIIRFCPDAKPLQINVLNKTGTFDYGELSVVILSQSCDIDRDKIDRIILCPIWKVNDYYRYQAERYLVEPKFRAKFNGVKDFKGKMESLLSNIYADKVNGLRILKENVEDSVIEPYIVDFGNIYTLPCGYVKTMIENDPRNSERLRLLPDFRVDLQAKFFNFLARGALPDGGIPQKIKIDPGVFEELKKLENG